jgi:nicotinamide mononucleotide (NMN) deamidase PncC
MRHIPCWNSLMNPDIVDLVSRLHIVDRRVVLAVTGGGATAAAWLLSVPGGSRTILEVTVPYAQEALDGFLGCSPQSYGSAQTAQQLARRARERAAWLAPGAHVVGIGCTASLRSDRPKKGDHRVHVAAATALGIHTCSLTLAKEQRPREQEEEIASRLVLNALARAFDLPQRLTLPLLPGEAVIEEEQATMDTLTALVRGVVAIVCAEPDGRLRPDAEPPRALLPGSFNPLHAAHLGLAEVAGRRLGVPVAFELSAVNVDKPALDEAELRRRLAQFATGAPLWLTRAPTFVEKARLFPGCWFVVGADTAMRIVQARYHGDSADSLRAALAEICDRECRFLVAGRVVGEQFTSVDRLEIPGEYRGLFEGLSESDFRLDISSTHLRQRSG